jgi:hypothetical protein
VLKANDSIAHIKKIMMKLDNHGIAVVEEADYWVWLAVLV